MKRVARTLSRVGARVVVTALAAAHAPACGSGWDAAERPRRPPGERPRLAPAGGVDPAGQPGPDAAPDAQRRDEPAGHIRTIAGAGKCFEGGCYGGFGGDGGPAAEAQLYLPQDLLIDGDTFYLADWNNHRIRRWGAEGVIETIAGNGFLGVVQPGPALEATLNHPTHLARDRDGDLVIAAWHNSKVVRYAVVTGLLEHVAGTGARALNGDGAPADRAAFDLPASVAFHPHTGDLYVMDQANQMIRAIGADGRLRRVAGAACVLGDCPEGVDPVPCPAPNTGKLACDPDLCRYGPGCPTGFAGDGGPATEARIAQSRGDFADPGGRMVFDRDGTLYFADTFNHRIRRIDPEGIIDTVAGAGTPATATTVNCATGDYGGDGGRATDALLNCPVDVDLGGDGTLYLADTRNHCLRAVDPAGVIRTVAGRCGQPGFAGDGGPATEALLHEPFGIALAGVDLLVVDTRNNRVRLVRGVVAGR